MESRSSEELKATALVERAEFWESSGDLIRAETSWKEAISLWSTPALQQQYAHFLARHSRFADAVQVLLSLLNGAETSGNLVLLQVLCQNLTALLREWGHPGLAARYATLAVPDAGSLPASDFLDAGNDALLHQDYPHAKACFQKALSLADGCKDIVTLADARASLGVLSLLEFQPAEAKVQLELACCLHEIAGDEEGMLRDMLNLAEVCYQCGEWQRGCQIVSRLLQEFQSRGMPHLQQKAESLWEDLCAADLQ